MSNNSSFKHIGYIDLENESDIISSKYGVQNMDILVRRVNGNVLSIETDLVELRGELSYRWKGD